LPALLAALAGLVLGHLVRRGAAWLAGVKGSGLPFKWPWLEAVSAAAFAVVAWLAPAPPWFILTALLVGITGTDFLAKLIPNRITFPGTAIGIVASAVWPGAVAALLGQERLLDAIGLAPNLLGGLVLGVLGAAAGFLVLEIFRRGVGAIVGMEVLGMGDSKLLLMAGAFLGPYAILLSIVPALVSGIVLGVPYTKLAKTPHLPFGPALALGAYLTLLFGAEILDAWLGLGQAAVSMSPKARAWTMLILFGVAIWLLVRVRRRREEYTRQIEEDYDRLEERD
jgi:leader peptidase (prepilin peptidase)/N-methyltransferase